MLKAEADFKYSIKYIPDLFAFLLAVISKYAPPLGLPLPSATALIIASEHSARVLKKTLSKITLLFLSLITPKKLPVAGSPANKPSYEGGS